LKVNKAGGKVSSLRTTAPRRYSWLTTQQIQIEEVGTYEEATTEAAEAVKKANTLPPLCNYPAEGCTDMESKQWDRLYKDYKGTKVVAATETHGAHRIRWEYGGTRGGKVVFLTDKPRKDPPKKAPTPATTEQPEPEPIPDALQFDAEEAEQAVTKDEPRAIPPAPAQPVAPTLFDQFEQQLRTGIQTVTSETLYPTPPDLARRMVELAGVEAGECVLEPSAGTGNIVQAVRDAVDTEVLAYEVNTDLCRVLRQRFEPYACAVRQADFLTVTDFQGQYPVVLMNPPFNGGQDIKHIEHALTFLRPGGRLVAICANGPRQRAAFINRAEHWEDLTDGTFKEAGTNVRTAMFLIRK
jgi:predicted RNA methylase